ncbi:hypothetical protein AAF712_006940 [Marasmius tenuissimus]|uniref:Uncharacterized protein n=1 Tax=Marasmius tenuissimus TaxID=585030 RepID=A0ABR2ZZ95_9AGAR
MAKSTKSAAPKEVQVSPRKVRPMPSRRNLRAGAKRQEEDKPGKENDGTEEIEVEEQDLASLKTRRTPRKPASRAGRNAKAPKSKAKAKPLAKSLDEDEEMEDLPEDEDIEEGDLGVVGRGGGTKRTRKEYDSNALDDDDDDEDTPTKKRTSTKRKRASTSESPAKKPPSRKKRRRVAKDETEDEYEDLDLKEGQEVVGQVVQAPKTGRVPAGQISKNTMDFLTKLADPACNDREWFKLHEPVYRLAEKEWKDFVEKFTDLLIEVDDQIPPLPPRDIRFSNDKTPYKRSFSASFSRSGRKGIFAHYHISGWFASFVDAYETNADHTVRPGGQSIIAGGSWCPGRNELATIRANLMRNPQPFRDIISAPDFVEYFGEAKPQANGERSNIFGGEDELKIAPKGVEKDHKDIDLLKCRSFAVVHKFLDSEVLEPDFNEKLAEVATVLQPFVHCLNDLMVLQDGDDDDDG